MIKGIFQGSASFSSVYRSVEKIKKKHKLCDKCLSKQPHQYHPEDENSWRK